jgi:hypothetical protein
VSMFEMNNGHEHLRTWLAKRLRMEHDPDRFGIVWDCLLADRVIEEWRQGYFGKEGVLEAARRLLRRFRSWESPSSPVARNQEWSHPGVPSRPPQDMEVNYSDRERDMVGALSKYMALKAAQLPVVRIFREETLPHGELLRETKEITDFLLSQPGVQKWISDTHGVEPGEFVKVKGWWPLAYLAEQVMTVVRDLQLREGVNEWYFNHRVGKYVIRRDMQEYTDLGKLVELLMHAFPWNHAGEVALFLIAGSPPPHVPDAIRWAMHRDSGTFSIEFLPWVSEETILSAYRDVRRFSDPNRLPREDSRTLLVFHFVVDQADRDGNLPSWRELLRRWNDTHPEVKFSDRSAIRRAYMRAVDVMTPYPNPYSRFRRRFPQATVQQPE